MRDVPASNLRQELERNDDGVCLDTQSLPLSRKDEWKQRRQKGTIRPAVDGQSEHLDEYTKEPQTRTYPDEGSLDSKSSEV